MLFALFSLAFAEDLWALAPTTGTRWMDVADVSVELAAGDRVEVLVRDGDKVRVRKSTSFGWVAASALTNVEPPKVEGTLGGEGGGFPTFTIPGAEETTK